MTPTAARPKLSPEQIRAGLIDLGLREEREWIDGFAFTYWKAPEHAVITYQEMHGGAEPTRFYLHSHRNEQAKGPGQ